MDRYDEERWTRPRGSAPLRLLLALTAGLALTGVMAGCGDGGQATGEAENGLSAAEFVAVVTALRQAERALEREDSAVALYADRKAEILAEHAVTEEELRAFLIRHQEDPTLLQEAWDSISQRLKHVPGADDGLPLDDPLELESAPGDGLGPPGLPPVRRPDDDRPLVR